MFIGVNEMVKRQTEDSKYSHFKGTFENLVNLVNLEFENRKPGYRDGVVLISIDPEGFFSGVTEVTEKTHLFAEFSARKKGEDPYIQIVAYNAEKLPAKFVEIVLYRNDVLGSDASTDAEWEIVSINARPTEEDEPMQPMAMARNYLGLAGGTKAECTADEFARSIIYWSKRAMCGSRY